MDKADLKARTKRFALDVIMFVEGLPDNQTCRVLGRQLLRSGTSVGANYRATCRAKSKPDFISKMGNVEEEADDSSYWLKLLVDDRQVTNLNAGRLIGAANELLAIAVASIRTARQSGGQQ